MMVDVNGGRGELLVCLSTNPLAYKISIQNDPFGVPIQNEPSGTHLDPNLCPDGISIVPWKHGKFLAWDVTVADTLAPTYLGTTNLRAGAAAGRLEGQKKLKYKDLLPQ